MSNISDENVNDYEAKRDVLKVVQANTFVALQQVYRRPDGVWDLAQANSAATLKMGTVIDPTANDFTVVTYGDIPAIAHGVAIGETLYLDDVVPGGTVPAPPATGLSQPALQSIGVDNFKVLDYNNDGQSSLLALDDLTDVNAANPALNNVLTYDGAEWVDQAPPVAAPASALATETFALFDAFANEWFNIGYMPVGHRCQISVWCDQGNVAPGSLTIEYSGGEANTFPYVRPIMNNDSFFQNVAIQWDGGNNRWNLWLRSLSKGSNLDGTMEYRVDSESGVLNLNGEGRVVLINPPIAIASPPVFQANSTLTKTITNQRIDSGASELNDVEYPTTRLENDFLVYNAGAAQWQNRQLGVNPAGSQPMCTAFSDGPAAASAFNLAGNEFKREGFEAGTYFRQSGFSLQVNDGDFSIEHSAIMLQSSITLIYQLEVGGILVGKPQPVPSNNQDHTLVWRTTFSVDASGFKNVRLVEINAIGTGEGRSFATKIVRENEITYPVPAVKYDGLTPDRWYRFGNFGAYSEVVLSIKDFQSGASSGSCIVHFSGGFGGQGKIKVTSVGLAKPIFTNLKLEWNGGTQKWVPYLFIPTGSGNGYDLSMRVVSDSGVASNQMFLFEPVIVNINPPAGIERWNITGLTWPQVYTGGSYVYGELNNDVAIAGGQTLTLFTVWIPFGRFGPRKVRLTLTGGVVANDSGTWFIINYNLLDANGNNAMAMTVTRGDSTEVISETASASRIVTIFPNGSEQSTIRVNAQSESNGTRAPGSGTYKVTLIVEDLGAA